MQSALMIFLAVGLAFLIFGGLGLILWRPIFNLGIDAFVKRLMKDPYPENIAEMYNVFSKVGVQNVIETDLRGTSGEALQRPFGTPIHFSPWEKLLLNPVYFSRKPILEGVEIDTKVVLGPHAKRPLYIDIPILISGMAYGIGLSANAKVALAKASAQLNTATNTGVGPFLEEERKYAKHLIIQYHRGSWAKDEAVLRQADAIEIQLGYGALGSVPVKIKAGDLAPEFHDFMGLSADEGLTLSATLAGAEDQAGLTRLVSSLRKITNGAPIGVKIGATHRLEAELEIITKAGIDFLTIDGAEAGINYGPGLLEDDLGLPTLAALCRTVEFLRHAGLKGRVSLIISGGLFTPGQFLKAIALGADAVAIGTIALVALSHSQLAKVIPFEPPTELVYDNGKAKAGLEIDAAAKGMENFLKSCKAEIILGLRSMGWTSLKDLSKLDLCALTPEVAELTGVEPGYLAPKRMAAK